MTLSSWIFPEKGYVDQTFDLRIPIRLKLHTDVLSKSRRPKKWLEIFAKPWCFNAFDFHIVLAPHRGATFFCGSEPQKSDRI